MDEYLESKNSEGEGHHQAGTRNEQNLTIGGEEERERKAIFNLEGMGKPRKKGKGRTN